MTTRNSTSGTDTRNANQWNRSSGTDTKTMGDDKKTGHDPEHKVGSTDPKKM